MKLHHRAIACDEPANVFDFAFQKIEIRRSHRVIFFDHHVACAEKAQAFTEWQMHVERKRRPRLIGAAKSFFEIVWPEIVLPHRSGWVAGVARTGAIVFLQKILGDFETRKISLIVIGVGRGHGCCS